MEAGRAGRITSLPGFFPSPPPAPAGRNLGAGQRHADERALIREAAAQVVLPAVQAQGSGYDGTRLRGDLIY